jgi:monoamine oxidase
VHGGPVAVFGPGALSQMENLWTPEGKIHWAGTELATEGQGFMEGAV